mmetsp:Transcript_4525/g.6791  ORF Transcript_4525/g.6791 Transcript_4525/m.6791 type:complete len:309 (+) Transcript_4525:41-967(+)
MWTIICYGIFFFVIYLAYRIGSSFLAEKLQVKPASTFGAGKGRWAVITGCTGGIGESYANEAARLGFNVLLVSRTESKLQKVQATLAQKFSSVKSDIYAFDFACKDDSKWEQLIQKVKSYDVGLLVNNVGINYPSPRLYGDADQALTERVIEVNILSVTRMSHAVLPAMLDAKSGAIVNVSSFTGRVPTPLLSVYSGTKAFVDYFSQGLNTEYASKGVVVQSVTPFLTVSAMTKIRKAGGMVADPDDVARMSLAKLGVPRTAPVIIHTIIIELFRSLPEFITSKILYSQNMATFKKWQRKQEQEQKSD